MAEEAFLARLIIIGGHHQHPVRTRFVGQAGEFNGFMRRVRPRAGDDGHAITGILNHGADDTEVFFVGKGG